MIEFVVLDQTSLHNVHAVSVAWFNGRVALTCWAERHLHQGTGAFRRRVELKKLKMVIFGIKMQNQRQYCTFKPVQTLTCAFTKKLYQLSQMSVCQAKSTTAVNQNANGDNWLVDDGRWRGRKTCDYAFVISDIYCKASLPSDMPVRICTWCQLQSWLKKSWRNFDLAMVWINLTGKNAKTSLTCATL